MENENKNLLLMEKELKELMTRESGRRAFIAAMPLLLASCATKVTSNRYREGDNKGQKAALTVDEEKKMTLEYLPKMKKDYPALKDAETQRYINELGQKIVSANGLNGKPYRYNFTVVDAKNVNAFALPAGTVFVTAPLIKMAETEAELAGVVGHEIGHITARHTAERLYAAQKAEKKTWLYTLGGGLVGGALGYGLSKIVCKKQDQECIRRVAMYGAMAGGGAGLLIQKYGFMANSREDEMEADRIGFRTSVAANFHKDYVGKFYEKLLVMEKKYQKNGQSNSLLKGVADAMSTHPPSEKRVSQMKSMASKQSAKRSAVVSSKAFQKMQDRLKKIT